MNLFHLSKCPLKSARYLCDKHIPKMTVETAQMLSTVHHLYDSDLTPDLYKPTHMCHPMTVWVGRSKENYLWTYRHFTELCKEFKKRYGKPILTERLLPLLANIPELVPYYELTTPPLCMPEQYQGPCPINAYRAYYQGAKRYFAKWERGTDEPWWWISNAELAMMDEEERDTLAF